MRCTFQPSIGIFLSLFNAVLNILFATVTGDIVFFYASYYYLSNRLLTLVPWIAWSRSVDFSLICNSEDCDGLNLPLYSSSKAVILAVDLYIQVIYEMESVLK